MASFLVLLRAGDNSLHPNWLSGAKRWDLAISYYGTDTDKAFPEASYTHRFQGGKWDGLYDFFLNHPRVLERYDYFWLPDDDILTDVVAINGLCALMERYRLELAQPSLTIDSYFSHLLTLRCSCFSIRYTNFVEIMAPILARSLLVQIIPLLKDTQSGFGLDLMWHRLTSDPTSKVGILDEISVLHTRPIGGALAVRLGHQTIPRETEEKIFSRRWRITSTHAVVFRGNLANGAPVKSQRLCAVIQFLCWSYRCWRFKWSGRGVLISIRKYYWFWRACMEQFIFKPEIAALGGATPRTSSANEKVVTGD
jgi:hypothetical protein